MKNKHRKSNDPKDARTSEGPNATAMGAITSALGYSKDGTGRKEKSSKGYAAQSARAREATEKAETPFPNSAQYARARMPLLKYAPNIRDVGLRALDGRTWSYRGKRARVVQMLASMPQGVTQWDCWPWHTRLGGTIHALRCDGLEISTELEGDCRHARYRLCMAGCLIIQAENNGEPVNIHREAP